MKGFTLARALLLGALLSFDLGLATPIAEGAATGACPTATQTGTTCSPVTITTTITKGRKKITTTITSTPVKCTTTPPPTSSSACYNCGNACPSPTAVTITKTLNWEDVTDPTASRTPIPQPYNDFSIYNPSENKVYKPGPPPNSVGNGSQVAYANDGAFGLGALGWVPIIKSFWLLTFFNNGITSATIRVSGPLYPGFTQTITADRTFVQILAPTTQSNTAPGLFIEVFAGPTASGTRLPAWIDDLVYERTIYPASCCQLAGTSTILNFNDRSGVFEYEYNGFQFPEWVATSLPALSQYTVTQGQVLYHQPGTGRITSVSGNFNLLRLKVFVPQATAPVPGGDRITWITIRGYDEFGNENGVWEAPAVTFQETPALIDFGADWTTGGAGPATGYFAASGFRNIKEITVMVEERTTAQRNGQGTQLEYWIDDFEFQYAC